MQQKGQIAYPANTCGAIGVEIERRPRTQYVSHPSFLFETDLSACPPHFPGRISCRNTSAARAQLLWPLDLAELVSAPMTPQK